MSPQAKPQTFRLVGNLALLDLKHEWILTLCMILAIAAILAPLLILLGLKHGTVETMRERLIEDPVNREIKPARTLQLSPRWFESFAQKPEVGFVIPTILRGSSVLRVTNADNNRSFTFDLIPTAANDPLLLENQGIIPQAGECTVSFTAAEKLGVKAGDMLQARVTRNRRGRREAVKIALKVTSVLAPRADALERIYAPLKFVTDVESYREGQAVPERQWSGSQPTPFLSFDGVFVLLAEPLPQIAQRKLMINTGLASIEEVKAEAFQAFWGFALPADYSAYRLVSRGNAIQIDNIKQLKNKLRGKSAILLPFVQETTIDLAGKTQKVVGLSLSANQTEKLGLPALPWGKLEDEGKFNKQGQILLTTATSTGLALDTSITAKAAMLDGEVQFPLHFKGNAFSDFSIVPAELVGALKTATQRRILFDAEQNSFLLEKAGFRGFRLYTRSIDDVPSLYREFIEQNIDVLTQVQEIERVKILDRGLTRIFWLVAIVGIVGGIAALVASLYAAVERKKRDIGVLRLMGLSRNAVFWFPIYQGVTIAALSVVVAIGVFSALASVINFVFAADLKLGEKICFLPFSYFLYAFLLTTFAAALSSLLAAWKSTAIDPAEAIREE